MARRNPNVDNTSLVQWNISGETFDSGYVLLDTTTPKEGTALTLDIEGVVEVLNSFEVATFFFIGTIIYAIDIVDPSVTTADLTIGDTTFNIGTGFNSQAYFPVEQSDGKILISGGFISYNGTTANRIIRLNTDGSIDSTFVYGTGFNTGLALAIAIQPDGKILVGGEFTAYQGTAASKIIRLNSDGSIDGTFNPGTGFNNTVNAIAIQADGKIIVGGQFNSYNGTGANRIIRLDPDGSIDATFVYGLGFNSTVQSIVIQADGKIIVGGGYTGYQGTGANRIIRLDDDGSIDGTFVYGTGFNGVTPSITIDSNDKILIGGNFTTYNGTGANRIIRLDDDGSIDGTFVYGTGFSGGIVSIEAITIQPDNKIMAGGEFTAYNGTGATGIIRLNADGSVDGAFNSGTGINNNIWGIAVLSSGKIIAVGGFTTYNGDLYNFIVRLLSNGTSDTTT
jgi:uncharacterized delta-60 repeat protein